MIDDEALKPAEEAIRPFLVQLDELKGLIASHRPLDQNVVARLENAFEVDFVFHSNAIEGNPLNRRETELILERGLTVDSVPLRHHLEVVNLRGGYRFVQDLARGQEPLSEQNIKEVHHLVLKGIQDSEAGQYRTSAVRITGTEHEPLDPVLIPEYMERFVSWLNSNHKLHPLVLAAGAHWAIVNIHPFRDGNGRVARLLMNFILWKAGYPIVIVREEDRDTYYDALEAGDAGSTVQFCEFVATAALRSGRSYERAIAEQARAEQLLGGLVMSVSRQAKEKELAYYEIWKSRMESVKAEFKSQTGFLRAKLSGRIDLSFEDFGMIGFEKFSALIQKSPVPETWFFRIRLSDIAGKVTSYVFWFGFPSNFVTNFTRRPSLVTLLISERKNDEWQKLVGPGVPRLREIFEHTNQVYRCYWIGDGPHDTDMPIQPASAATVATDFFKDVLSTF